jgi:hypothetical protein
MLFFGLAMAFIVRRMQISARRRQGFIPKAAAHMAQIRGLIRQ